MSVGALITLTHTPGTFRFRLYLQRIFQTDAILQLMSKMYINWNELFVGMHYQLMHDSQDQPH